MSRFVRFVSGVTLVVATAATAHAQGRPLVIASTRADSAGLRTADGRVDQMVRSGELRVSESVRDTLIPDRAHERLDQYVRGVRVVGGDITRQTAVDGTVSIFGTLHDIGALAAAAPQLSNDEARTAIDLAAAGTVTTSPELVVLPMPDGYHLAYTAVAATATDRVHVYVDANSGALLARYSDFVTEVGVGIGTYGDQKKLSVKAASGAFVADDSLRPAAITTYDMKGDLNRTLNVLNVVTSVAPSDIALDTDNNWTDRTVVDAHVYAGWYYDYLSRRFDRNGLDNRNLRMPVFVHPVRIEDINRQPTSVVGLFYINAFSCSSCGPNGRGAVVMGEGAPNGVYYRGIDVKPFSAALDVVAHELTHQVTANTARLNGFQYSEAGALNEGFSDIFGTSAAFFYLPTGSAAMQASYLMGKDLTVPSGVLSRSLSNPRSTGDPDHYSLRIVGYDSHYNSTILSHAFFLAVEGGTNRTSGISVQGVGASNREQIEKVFFRALTALLPSSATYPLTRAATIQSARDLYGAGSAAERAVTQAWAAVGVADRTAATATILPNPPVSDASCNVGGLTPPTWPIYITLSAGSSNLRVTAWTWDFYDHTGALQDHEVLTPTNFAASFNRCGAGSNFILGQSDACAVQCMDLRGDTAGSTQITFTALDDAGQTVTVSTGRITVRK